MSWMKDYFSFTKRERNAFIALIVLTTGFIFLPDLIRVKRAPLAVDALIQDPAGNKNDVTRSADTNDASSISTLQESLQPSRPTMFVFDPNTLDEKGWMALGLTQRTARTIINYRNKGGRFRTAEDIRKIYSLRQTDADRLIPFIEIKSDPVNPTNDHRSNTGFSKFQKPAIQPIDINTASVEEWKSLPGIGEVLSARIVKFRERLGGFSSIDQVAKTYALKDSTFQLIKPYLKLSSPATLQVNINTASENELMECSAVTKEVAQAIVIYRKQKGRFEKLEDLRKIVFINEAMYKNMCSCLKAE